MTKLDLIPPPAVGRPTPPALVRRPCARLIVLFPASAADLPRPTQQIWEIARSSGLMVVLLGLTRDGYEESGLRRELASMAAMISDGRVRTEIRIEHGSNWLRALRRIYRPGDAIACYEGHRTELRRRPLSQMLEARLKAPVHILSAGSPVRSTTPRFVWELYLWLGNAAILGGFLWLQLKIAVLPDDWAHTSLLYLFTLLEIALLWLWNSGFSHPL